MKSKLIVHIKGIHGEQFVVNTIEVLTSRQNKVSRLEYTVEKLDQMTDKLINKIVERNYELDVIIETQSWGIALADNLKSKLSKRGYDFDIKTGEITKSDEYNHVDTIMEFMMEHQLLMTYVDDANTGREFGKTHMLIKKALEEDIMIVTGMSTVANNMIQYAELVFGKSPVITVFNDSDTGNIMGIKRGTRFFVDEFVSNDKIKLLIEDFGFEFLGGFNSLETSTRHESVTLLDLIDEKIQDMVIITPQDRILLATLEYLKEIL